MSTQAIKQLVQRNMTKVRPFSTIQRADPKWYSLGSLTQQDMTVADFRDTNTTNYTSFSSHASTSDFEDYQRWKKLAELTNDPMIEKMSSDLAEKCGIVAQE